jgi:hypothetical protein
MFNSNYFKLLISFMLVGLCRDLSFFVNNTYMIDNLVLKLLTHFSPMMISRKTMICWHGQEHTKRIKYIIYAP